MPARQYPRAREMTFAARLKMVATLRGRGWSATRIARELDYDVRTARKDFAAVENAYRDHEDIGRHLNDVLARTGEQLQKLNEQEAILWRQLDWASERVVQVDGFGAKLYEINEDGSQGALMYGPRKPGLVNTTIAQLSAIQKQQSELLGILNKNVDISMKLQLTMEVQKTIIEAVKSTDPAVYAQIRRQIKAAVATIETPALPSGLAVTSSSGEALEAELLA